MSSTEHLQSEPSLGAGFDAMDRRFDAMDRCLDAFERNLAAFPGEVCSRFEGIHRCLDRLEQHSRDATETIRRIEALLAVDPI